MSYPERPPARTDAMNAQHDTGVRRGNGMAVAALVLGILAVVLFWTVVGGALLGLLAVVFGVIGARSIEGLARRFEGEEAPALLAGSSAHSCVRLDVPFTAGLGLPPGLGF